MAQQFKDYITTRTEDASPDLTNDFIPTYDASATTTKKVRVGNIGGFVASTTEVLTGTDTSKRVTPDALAALWEQGSDIASAGTVSVGEGGYFNITGTTTITDIDFATDKAGRRVWFKFAGILILTHHSTTLILPTGANITTAAGDIACFVSEGSDNVRCVAYTRASGAALIGGGITNSAGANVMMKSDGTNAVASGFTNATASTLTTAQTEAVLEQTGDSIGASRLRLRNRSGTNGAVFESAVNDLCDFTFSGSASSLGWRMEGRSGGYQTGVKEFQVHDAGTVYHAFSQNGHWMTETTAPAAPAANSVIIYAVDNGAGKTQLMALFSSGAAQQIAIQP